MSLLKDLSISFDQTAVECAAMFVCKNGTSIQCYINFGSHNNLFFILNTIILEFIAHMCANTCRLYVGYVAR